MALSTSTQNVMIAVLAVLAVAASIFAIWSVQQPRSSLLDGNAAVTQSVAGSTAVPAGEATDAKKTTAERHRRARDDGATNDGT